MGKGRPGVLVVQMDMPNHPKFDPPESYKHCRGEVTDLVLGDLREVVSGGGLPALVSTLTQPAYGDFNVYAIGSLFPGGIPLQDRIWLVFAAYFRRNQAVAVQNFTSEMLASIRPYLNNPSGGITDIIELSLGPGKDWKFPNGSPFNRAHEHMVYQTLAINLLVGSQQKPYQDQRKEPRHTLH